jgi:hypothetical protein
MPTFAEANTVCDKPDYHAASLTARIGKLFSSRINGTFLYAVFGVEKLLLLFSRITVCLMTLNLHRQTQKAIFQPLDGIRVKPRNSIATLPFG